MNSASSGQKNRSASRVLLVAFDIAWLMVIALLLGAGLPDRAYAYVDPSVMTYTIQAVAGVAVALSAVAGVAFRRSRRAIMRLFHINENANKQVDAPWHRIEANEQNRLKSFGWQADSSTKAKAAHSKHAGGYAPKWLQRLLFSLVVVGFALFTLFIVAPFEIVAASKGSLVFGLNVVWPPVVFATVALIVVCAVVLSLFRGRVFNVLLMLAFAFGVCFYVQAMFLNSGLTIANGEQVNWIDYRRQAVVSFIVWLAIILVLTIASTRWKKQFQLGAVFLSVVLVIVQGVGIVSLFTSEGDGSRDGAYNAPLSDYVVTEQDMFTVSAKKNVIVFVLDTYDTQFLEDALVEDPHMLDELTGFTWFKNSTGSMIPTRYGNVFLMTGQYPRADEGFQTFLKERWKRSSFLSDIESAGYSIGLYSDTFGQEYLQDNEVKDLIYDKTVNIHPTARPAMDDTGTVLALYKCALYRDLPWMAKPFLWFYTDEINARMSNIVSADDFASTPVLMDDVRWYDKLKQFGVTAVEDDTAGAFRYIHLIGTHWPYSMDENGLNVGLHNATVTQVARGSMKMTVDYIKELKRLGVYDDTTIIITADHGDYYPIYSYLEDPTSPIALVKPAQSAELDAEPLKVSMAPIAPQDLLATIVQEIGQDSTSYGPTVYDIPEDQRRVRHYDMTINNEEGHDVTIVEYEIDGDVLDFSTWRRTGQEWDVWAE